MTGVGYDYFCDIMSLSRKTGRAWIRLKSSLARGVDSDDHLMHSMPDIERIFIQGNFKKRRQWQYEVS